MIQRAYPLLVVAAIGVAGCDRQVATDAPTNQVAAIEQANDVEIAADEGGASVEGNAATATRDLTGRWIGVEGMVLDIAAGQTPGAYRLTMQWDLDHKGSFIGRAADDGIAFERGGTIETLRPTDGAATGLKYLAGKRDCLTVKPGEGYCRG